MSKTVQVIAHAFDCLPGHILIEGRGSGSTVRIAVCRAVEAVFQDRHLHRKQVGDFKLSVVVIADKTIARGAS